MEGREGKSEGRKEIGEIMSKRLWVKTLYKCKERNLTSPHQNSPLDLIFTEAIIRKIWL